MARPGFTREQNLQLDVLFTVFEAVGLQNEEDILRVPLAEDASDSNAIREGRQVLALNEELRPVFSQWVTQTRLRIAREKIAAREQEAARLQAETEALERELEAQQLSRELIERIHSGRALNDLVFRGADPLAHVPDALSEFDDELDGHSPFWERGQPRTALGLCAHERLTSALGPMLDEIIRYRSRFDERQLKRHLSYLIRRPTIRPESFERIIREFQIEFEQNQCELARAFEIVRSVRRRGDSQFARELETSLLVRLEQGPPTKFYCFPVLS